MDDFKSILIKKDGKIVEVINNSTSYRFLGKGAHGAVFQLNDEQCVKIYGNPKDVEYEVKALETVQGLSFTPTIFEIGQNYIIMEYLKGPNLKMYLREKRSISESISQQILFILKEMELLGFQIDDALRHFIVTEQEVLKLIDLVSVHTPKKHHLKNLFRELKELRLLNTFLEHAKKMEPEMYLEWDKKIRFKK